VPLCNVKGSNHSNNGGKSVSATRVLGQEKRGTKTVAQRETPKNHAELAAVMPASRKQRACIWPWETAQPCRPAGVRKSSNSVRRHLRSQSVSTDACQLQTLRSAADLCSNAHQMSPRRSSMPAVSRASPQNSKHLGSCCYNVQCKTNSHVLSESLMRSTMNDQSLCSSSASTAMVACDSPATYSSTDTVSAWRMMWFTLALLVHHQFC
jgi:hypothetical protein